MSNKSNYYFIEELVPRIPEQRRAEFVNARDQRSITALLHATKTERTDFIKVGRPHTSVQLIFYIKHYEYCLYFAVVRNIEYHIKFLPLLFSFCWRKKPSLGSDPTIIPAHKIYLWLVRSRLYEPEVRYEVALVRRQRMKRFRSRQLMITRERHRCTSLRRLPMKHWWSSCWTSSRSASKVSVLVTLHK